MDNDLMARRLRPPSQPTPQNAQSGQPPSPWVPLADESSFEPAEAGQPQNDPPFAPPDPLARADVPWDRPAPDAWPPAEVSGTDYPQTWSAQSGTPAADDAPAEWPSADATGDPPQWDRPAKDQSLDPDDAMAPVVGDFNVPAGVSHEWSGNGTADGFAANGNGNGHANGAGYAAASTPERMTVAAHSDQPRGGDEPRPDAWVDAFDTSPSNPGAGMSGGTGPSLPEWPAEDDLTPPPSSSRSPVMPEDSRLATPQDAAQPTDPAPEPTPAPEQPLMPASPPASPHPVAPPPTVTPIVTSAQIVPSVAGSPQNMVLRIELAFVDESRRADPTDAVKRVGPDAEVRAPEYNPRTAEGGASMPEPEYEWGAPPNAQDPRNVAPVASAWEPAPAQPQQMDWGLPQVGGPGPAQQPVAPPPTWAMTEPTPPFTPEPPQYIAPPAAPGYQQPYQPTNQPAWPPSQSPDPLYGVPAAPNQQPAGYSPASYQPAPYSQGAPTSGYESAPAAGSRARTGQANAAADQADLWFLSNQPADATTVDDDVQPGGKSSSILAAGLTVGFALLVIVLVLVFIQLMTSLLR